MFFYFSEYFYANYQIVSEFSRIPRFFKLVFSKSLSKTISYRPKKNSKSYFFFL